MNATDPFASVVAPFDFRDLDALQFAVARRADELARRDGGRHPERNFWEEAERELWPDGPAVAKAS